VRCLLNDTPIIPQACPIKHRACAIGVVVGVGHHASRGGHRFAVARRVVLVGKERIIRVLGRGQAVQRIVRVGDQVRASTARQSLLSGYESDGGTPKRKIGVCLSLPSAQRRGTGA
jgi:hypothetical protein